MYYTVGMRKAEIEVNKRVTFMANEAEHRAFKVKCVSEGTEMASVLRRFMRDYVSKKKK